MSEKEELYKKILEQIREEVKKLVVNYNFVEETKSIISFGISEKGNYFTSSYEQSEPIEKFFLDNTIKITGLDFYQREKDEADDYFFILKKLKNIEFIDCTFKQKGLPFESIKIHYNNCTFLNQHIINVAQVLDKKDVLYADCTFNQAVFISDTLKVIDVSLFRNCTFINSIEASNKIFNKPVFLNTEKMKSRRINQIILTKCIFTSNFIIYNSNRESDKTYFHINKLDLTDSIFKAEDDEKVKVKIQFCEIKEAVFYNTSFHDLVDFYQTKFFKVNFERADFMNISVFSECEFFCDVDFKYVKFFGIAIFRDTVISKGNQLNLRDTIFNDDANFLDITSEKRMKIDGDFVGVIKDIQVANRETARVIKSFYEYFNNIIEANKFYALEMKEREKELEKDISKKRNIVEWLVFKVHGISSNHSQDWLLAFFWILNISFVAGLINFNAYENSMIIIPSIFIIIMALNISLVESSYKSGLLIGFSILSYFLYSGLTFDYPLFCLSNIINPFSIMTGKEHLTFSGLIYKVIIAYLIYQLIISIRQNTRRK